VIRCTSCKKAIESVMPEARKAQALSMAARRACSSLEPAAVRHLLWPAYSMHTSQEYPPRLSVE
jgi:hypothetical protein